MAKKASNDDSIDMENEENYELEDPEEYDILMPREPNSSNKRRRIEELMEEKELHDSIYGDIY